MDAGSLRGSTFQLSAAAIGAGVLSLPYVFTLSGWVLGTILIIIGALTCYGSLMLLSISVEYCNAKSYTDLTKKIFGDKWGTLPVVFIVANFFGSAISYQIIIMTMIRNLAVNVFNVELATMQKSSV